MKIRLIGTAYPYRGGLAIYNERLMEEFASQGNEVCIETFSLQYPKILFPGKTQYADWDNPSRFPIIRSINSINPFNWIRVGNRIRKEKPDLVLVKYWIPFMSPCFSTIIRRIKKNNHTKVICIVDNIIPHEKRPFDGFLTRLFTKSVDGFIAMSQSVMDDINQFDKNKPRLLSPHPLFDNFGEKTDRKIAMDKLGLDPNDINLLFFGLIREYKGLDILIEALSDQRLRDQPIKLLVAGEFYESSKPYFDRIKELGLEDRIRVEERFIPDNEVSLYFSSTDLVVLPYKTATQSGVTQIGYHFSKPMLVTDVGGLGEIIIDKKTGYVVEPSPKGVADAILDFAENRPEFSEGIEDEKKKYTWDRMTKSILKIMEEI